MIDGVANFLLPPEGVPMPTINPMFPMLRGPPVMQVCLSWNDLVSIFSRMFRENAY
jgi:hypothetical protein